MLIAVYGLYSVRDHHDLVLIWISRHGAKVVTDLPATGRHREFPTECWCGACLVTLSVCESLCSRLGGTGGNIHVNVHADTAL